MLNVFGKDFLILTLGLINRVPLRLPLLEFDFFAFMNTEILDIDLHLRPLGRSRQPARICPISEA